MPYTEGMSDEVTHERAVEIDTQLAELWRVANSVRDSIASHKNFIAGQIGLKGKYMGRGRSAVYYYSESVDEVIELAEQKLADESFVGYSREMVVTYLDKLSLAVSEYKATRELAEPLEKIYDEHPWSRFYLVTNKNGHIHSSMQCHTCGPRTLFAWLPQLSGLTEKDAVDAHGTILCSHCFPTAPVEWTVGIQKEVDPTQCPGSGTSDFEQDTYKRIGWNGNGRAKCKHCGEFQAVTTAYNLRKHKRSN